MDVLVTLPSSSDAEANLETNSRTGERAQWVRMLVAKAENLNFSPQTHRVERENQLTTTSGSLTSTQATWHTHACTHVHARAHTHTLDYKIKLKTRI